jgi:hypothetical protein
MDNTSCQSGEANMLAGLFLIKSSEATVNQVADLK